MSVFTIILLSVGTILLGLGIWRSIYNHRAYDSLSPLGLIALPLSLLSLGLFAYNVWSDYAAYDTVVCNVYSTSDDDNLFTIERHYEYHRYGNDTFYYFYTNEGKTEIGSVSTSTRIVTDDELTPSIHKVKERSQEEHFVLVLPTNYQVTIG